MQHLCQIGSVGVKSSSAERGVDAALNLLLGCAFGLGSSKLLHAEFLARSGEIEAALQFTVANRL